MSESKKAVLYRMVMADKRCPSGIKSKDLLERQGYAVEDHHLTSRDDVDAFKEKHDVQTTPQTFIGEKRIGGYDDLRDYFDLPSFKQEGKTYAPIIAVFSVTFLMAFAAVFAFGSFLSFDLFYYFIAFSMCVLAILKLRDLDSFTNQFVTYDLLAMRDVRYAYVYPFAEAFVGIGMIAGVFMPLIALIALCVGGLGAVSVIKAIYIDKRDLKCACVGGESNVPLGFISLAENLAMVLMGAAVLIF